MPFSCPGRGHRKDAKGAENSSYCEETGNNEPSANRAGRVKE